MATTSAPSGSPNCRRKASRPTLSLLDSYVGAYHWDLAACSPSPVRVNGSLAQETGRPKFEITARGVDAFASSHDDLVVFLRDGQAKVTQALLSRAGVWRTLGAAGRRGQGEGDRGRFCAADRGGAGSVQGSNPAAGQQGGDPARDRRSATRRAELRADERAVGGQDPSPGFRAAGHVQGVRRGGIRSSSAASVRVATTSTA